MIQTKFTKPIDEHLEAYQRKNIEAFSSYFSENIKSWNASTPEKSWSGKEELKKRYQNLFEKSDKLEPKILNRIVTPPYVIDEEFVTGIPNSPEGVTVGVVYKLTDGLISEMCFLR